MKSIFLPIVACALWLAAVVYPAQADLIFNAVESGGNVVISGDGSVDLSGLVLLGEAFTSSAVTPDEAIISVGGTVDLFTGIAGPASFGTTGGGFASSTSGPSFALLGLGFGGGGLIGLPKGYTSGQTISLSLTFNGATFASLGMTPGTYIWSWGSGAHADSLTLNIGSQAIPEPGSLALVGVVGFLVLAARRHRRE